MLENFSKGGKLIWLEGKVEDEEEFYLANRKRIKAIHKVTPASFVGYGHTHSDGNKIWLGAKCHASKSSELSVKDAFLEVSRQVADVRVSEYELLAERFNSGNMAYVITRCRDDRFFWAEHRLTDEDKWVETGIAMSNLGLFHGTRWWAFLKSTTDPGKYVSFFRVPPEQIKTWSARYWQVWNELPDRIGIDISTMTMKVFKPNWEYVCTDHLPKETQAILEQTNGTLPININRHTFQYNCGDHFAFNTQIVTDYDKWTKLIKSAAMDDFNTFAAARLFRAGIAQRSEHRAEGVCCTYTWFDTLKQARAMCAAAKRSSFIQGKMSSVVRPTTSDIYKVLNERIISPFHVIKGPVDDTVLWVVRHNVTDVPGYAAWIDQLDMFGFADSSVYLWCMAQNVDEPSEVSMFLLLPQNKVEQTSMSFFDLIATPEFRRLVKSETMRILMYDCTHLKRYYTIEDMIENPRWGAQGKAMQAFFGQKAETK